jgi:hypothetical protein
MAGIANIHSQCVDTRGRSADNGLTVGMRPGRSEAIMKSQYQWITLEDGSRVFRVSNMQTNKSIDVPFAQGIARVTGSGLHGAKTNDELLMAKVVCDCNADIERIRNWLAGPNRGSVIKEFEDYKAKAEAEKAELLAKLKAAGIE